MSKTVHLQIPDDMPENVPMNVGDDLQIEIVADCTWCYSDPGGCFSSLLAPGYYIATTPPTVYPLYPDVYSTVKVGNVAFNAVRGNNTCNTGGETTGTMGHTITVTS